MTDQSEPTGQVVRESKVPDANHGGLRPFTFESSGKTILIRRVSVYTTMEWGARQEKNAPKPPMQEVDYGDGKKVLEPNPAHPDYIAETRKYQLETKEKFKKFMLGMGVVLELTDEMKQEVAEFRQRWKESGETDPLEENDKSVYLYHLCMLDPGDTDRVSEAILGMSQPTEGATQAALHQFRS